ncbi:hypothetical protein GJ700_33150 [Duganella sp. FT92W]|uniref:Uncharacterized protein n=1 Tax=Pseudoduganella rivuli TaxID=2666085 RepID=A0A7X2IUX9_9BURK|nr:hypothetical protein [Pseudoduganella rivuli]MRV76571.1 hypothetical protein [Pseudoduganella rivuli]
MGDAAGGRELRPLRAFPLVVGQSVSPGRGHLSFFLLVSMSEIMFRFEKVKGFIPWGFPLKLIITALVTLLSAHALGLISEYATYRYAFKFGVRVPFEGVPYLSAMVSIGSIFLLFGAAVVFSVTYLVLRFFLLPIIWSERLKKSLRLWFGDDAFINREIVQWDPRKLSLKKRWFIVLLASLVVAALMLFLFSISEKEIIWKDVTGEKWAKVLTIPYFIIVFSAILIPASTWISAALLVVAYFIGAIALMMQPFEYASLLRNVGYGGDLPIVLETKDLALQKRLESSKEIFLILKTNDTFIVRDLENMVLEVPRSEVTYWRYQKRDGNRLPWFLL